MPAFPGLILAFHDPTTMRSYSHHPRMHGYVLPLVIRAIESLGPPQTVSRIFDQSQQGPLLVTLAAELTVLVVGLIHESLSSQADREETEAFYTLRGGEPLRAVTDELDRNRREKNDLIGRIEDMEQRLVRCGLGTIVERQLETGGGSECAEGDFIQWNTSEDCSKTVEEMRRGYEDLVWRYRRVSKEVEKLRGCRLEMRRNVRSAPDFSKALSAHLNSRGLPPLREASDRLLTRDLIQFSSGHWLLNEGAAAFLRDRDPRWWAAFGRYVQEATKKVVSRGFVRLMLRDVRLAEIAEWRANESNEFIDGGWLRVLADPESARKYRAEGGLVAFRDSEPFERGVPDNEWYHVLALLSAKPDLPRWPAYNSEEKRLGETAVRFWRRQLREEDKFARVWMIEKSRGFHPCNWLDRKGISNSVEKCAVEYPVERALDELFWCLGDGQDFAPYLSPAWTLEQWQAWCDQARLGSPGYWRLRVAA